MFLKNLCKKRSTWLFIAALLPAMGFTAITVLGDPMQPLLPFDNAVLWTYSVRLACLAFLIAALVVLRSARRPAAVVLR